MRVNTWIGLYFPVSCSVGLGAGMYTMVELDARDISKGKSPHSIFYVIASTPKKNGSLVAISLKSIEPSLYDKNMNHTEETQASTLFCCQIPKGNFVRENGFDLSIMSALYLLKSN